MTAEQEPAPLRRSGRRCGFEGKPELAVADARLRAALSALARDPEPDARRAGARIAEQVTAALNRAAEQAERTGTAGRRLAARTVAVDAELARARQAAGQGRRAP